MSVRVRCGMDMVWIRARLGKGAWILMPREWRHHDTSRIYQPTRHLNDILIVWGWRETKGKFISRTARGLTYRRRAIFHSHLAPVATILQFPNRDTVSPRSFYMLQSGCFHHIQLLPSRHQPRSNRQHVWPTVFTRCRCLSTNLGCYTECVDAACVYVCRFKKFKPSPNATVSLFYALGRTDCWTCLFHLPASRWPAPVDSGWSRSDRLVELLLPEPALSLSLSLWRFGMILSGRHLRWARCVTAKPHHRPGSMLATHCCFLSTYIWHICLINISNIIVYSFSQHQFLTIHRFEG